MALLAMAGTAAWAQQPAHHWAIVLHGGAGVIERATMSPKTEAAYRASLKEAIEAGAKVLDRGGSSLDAIEAAIRILEDNPLFNAGRGAVFTADGKNEMDSAIMDGATLKAGAVAGVTRTRHPISLARAVMEKSQHVMLSGDGADAFAASVGLEQVAAKLLLHGAPLAVAGEAAEERGAADSAASGRRAACAGRAGGGD